MASHDAAARPAGRRRTIVRLVQGTVSVAVAVAIFAGIIPRIAGYGEVWRTITGLSVMSLAMVVGAMIFNLFTYWWQMMAAMPGLTLAQAAVNNQSSTTIADILPGGGAIAIGLVYAMFRSWGFSRNAIALLITTTGIWNSFLKLGLPVIALALLAITGRASASLVVPALVGLAILAGSVLLFAMALWKKRFARSIGSGLGRAWSWARRLVRRPPVADWGEGAVRFRKDTIRLVSARWLPLTLTTLLSHVALYAVLLLAVRAVGISESEISWVQVLAVFSLGRLFTALPITPGGVGFVELAYIAGLVLAGRGHVTVSTDEFHAQVAAAVLLFRTLTYGIQIPLGGFTYVIWRRAKRWRHAPVVEEHEEPVAVVGPPVR